MGKIQSAHVLMVISFQLSTHSDPESRFDGEGGPQWTSRLADVAWAHRTPVRADERAVGFRQQPLGWQDCDELTVLGRAAAPWLVNQVDG